MSVSSSHGFTSNKTDDFPAVQVNPTIGENQKIERMSTLAITDVNAYTIKKTVKILR